MNACCPSVPSTATAPRVVEPFADVRRGPAGYTVELDLPGVTGADLSIELNQGVLTVTGTSTVAFDTDKPARAAEFTGRAYRRAFRLGEGLNREAIRATHRLGVLRLDIPFQAQAAPRKIQVVSAETPPSGA